MANNSTQASVESQSWIAKWELKSKNAVKDFPSSGITSEKHHATIQDVYRSYGFCPIDTPVLEHLEILLGEGSDET